MVRLMLTLTPVVCVCGAIVVSDILTTYLDLRKPSWTKGEDPKTVVNEVMSSSKTRRPSTTQDTTGTDPCNNSKFPNAPLAHSSLVPVFLRRVIISRNLPLGVKISRCNYVHNLPSPLRAPFHIRH
jgi:hypothetical protein